MNTKADKKNGEGTTMTTLRKGTRVRLAEKIMDYPEGMEATIERLRACPHEAGTIIFKLEGIPHWVYAEDLAPLEGAPAAKPAEPVATLPEPTTPAVPLKANWDGSGEQMDLSFMEPDSAWRTMKGMAL